MLEGSCHRSWRLEHGSSRRSSWRLHRGSGLRKGRAVTNAMCSGTSGNVRVRVELTQGSSCRANLSGRLFAILAALAADVLKQLLPVVLVLLCKKHGSYHHNIGLWPTQCEITTP